MFDYATDYSILIQLCILCNMVYMRDIKVFGVLFVGRLLLILLEQDCTCLPCNLLNTISSCVHQRLYFISRWHAPEMIVVFMHSLYVTHRCNKTDSAKFVLILIFCRHCGRVSFYFLGSLIVNCWNDWFCQYKKVCISQAQIAGNNLVWHNFYSFPC